MRKGSLERRTPAELELGLMLFKLRERRGLKQDELAEMFGLSSGSSISDWERGEVIPQPAQLARYVRVFPEADRQRLLDARERALEARRRREQGGEIDEAMDSQAGLSNGSSVALPPDSTADESAASDLRSTNAADTHPKPRDVETTTGARTRRRSIVAGAFSCVVAAVILSVTLLISSSASTRPWRAPVGAGSGVTIVVDSRSAIGPRERLDVGQPLQLVREPSANCSHCVIPGTVRRTGQTYLHAVCQVVADEETNGNLSTPGTSKNPGLAFSRRWFGIRQTNGTLGFVNAVWIAASDRNRFTFAACLSPGGGT